ncbi:MAG TPA: CDP-alcohol phosphatidyltransferase family protein [Marmoricola sp.]|nr:CDP-alcohol phosphatidyltransferase family protein [Marmoricola sp.]
MPLRSHVASLASLVVLLTLLTATSGLAPLGWAAGLACGAVLVVCVAVGQRRYGVSALGPADRVTLARATLACGVAALVVDDMLAAPSAALVPLAAVALALDAVDGPVARRTETVSPFGGRFDGEVDAFLMLVLSVHLTPSLGWWVLAIGGVRYVFGAAGWWLPWMRRQLPFRYWRKVVTAVQGIVLVVAASAVLPVTVDRALLLGALLLLAESFGRDVLWLWRRRTRRSTRRARTVSPVPVPRP